jgi:A/G-specific adenine glycosylase
MPPKLRSVLRQKLLRWYRNNKRDLPWRRTRDPYAIWISETMLQQTRVAVVVPYYEKFLTEFPTIDALARAPLSRVLRLWSGLGYYRRAENLRQAARQIVQLHGGIMPRDFAQLRALAGVGDYTAGALMSIAFDKPYPAIDGNVRRVIGRLLGNTDESRLRAIAAELLPRTEPGEFNQALMELGATTCTPKNQSCPACALRSSCASQTRTGATAAPRKRVKFKSVTWPLAIVRHGGKILLRRRSAGGLLGSLWELPGEEMKPREAIAALLRRQMQDLDIALPPPRKLGVVHHAITHRRIRAPIYLFDLDGRGKIILPRTRWRWIEGKKLATQATSSMTVKAGRFLFTHEEALH